MAKAYCFSYGEVFEAYEDCIKNKRNTSNAREFEIDYIEKVTRLCDDINDGTYEIGKSIAFVVTFPVYREVFAADFRDRIVHHLVIKELMPHQIHISNVRIERLQEISDDDCLKEGLEWDGVAHKYYVNYDKTNGSKIYFKASPKESYAELIDKVSGKGTWESNPYVFVYDFNLVK